MNIQQILQFLHEVEKLKQELRHSWLSNWRQESVAEHTWRLSLMAILMHSKLDEKVDLLKVLKMSVIHDINEAYVWDVPAFDVNHSKQKDDEIRNIKDLLSRFPWEEMQEIHDLFIEYEDQKSYESKFVKALDKIEVRIQHNEADISTWNDIEFSRSLFAADKYCEFDNFLKEFNDMVKLDSENKIKSESDVDVEELKKWLNS